MDNEKNIIHKYSHSLSTIEANVLYRLSKDITHFYAGAGAGFTFVSLTLDGNTNEVDNKLARIKDADNSPNFNLLCGVNLAASETFSFIMEFLYRFIKINYYVELEDAFLNKSMIKQSEILHDILLNLGIRIRMDTIK